MGNEQWRSLPLFCGARHPVTNAPISIKRGERGYAGWPESTNCTPEDYNEANGIDEAVVQTMLACSMGGHWHKANVVAVRRSLERQKERQRLTRSRRLDKLVAPKGS